MAAAVAKIIDGATQNGKTAKVFEEIVRETEVGSNTLCLFVTQANSVTAVHQVVGRASRDQEMRLAYPLIRTAIEFRDGGYDRGGDARGNVMLVGYWHTRTVGIMLQTVQESRYDRVIVVVDEVEQGGTPGVISRFHFIDALSMAIMRECPIQLIFVTATVANFSKAVAYFSAVEEREKEADDDTRVIDRVLHERCVEHHFVRNKEGFVGPSWFVRENPELLRVLPALGPEDSRLAMVLEEMAGVADEHKELAMVVCSTMMDDHRNICEGLLDGAGFNVAVELNSRNGKDYMVYYLEDGNGDGELKTWALPFSKVEKLAQRGKLRRFGEGEGGKRRTGINTKYDVSVSYMLQAGLFMGTEAQQRIAGNVSEGEMFKLWALNHAMTFMLDEPDARPDDWPQRPRVALVAGAIAGRGNTFQNQAIDLACTAFCFTGTADKVQRGALNAQRFGRACGILGDIFMGQGRRPMLIATEDILQDALSNETALRKKASKIRDGELVALRDLISKEEWDRARDKAKKKLVRIVDAN